jgi:hypothetical protein
MEAGRDRDAAKTIAAVLPVVRSKYVRFTPPFAMLLATDASIRASAGDSVSSENEYRDALAALGGGTRVDSAAFPRIAVMYAAFLARHGRRATGDALIRQALAFVPRTADRSATAVAELQRGLTQP